jgi:hypothetical protein
MDGVRPIERPVSRTPRRKRRWTEAALKSCSLACKAVVAHYLNAEEAGQRELGRWLLRAAAAIDRGRRHRRLVASLTRTATSTGPHQTKRCTHS